jgi:carboxymethylenebutenolidase
MTIVADWIRLVAGGEPFAYVAAPREAGARRGLLVIHEGFGHNAYLQAMCRRLAGEGFKVIAPDLYRRLPERTAGYDEREKALALLRTLTDAQVLEDLERALDWLRQDPAVGPKPVGAVGFRVGGRYAVLLAGQRPAEIGAVVACYSSGLKRGFAPGWTMDAVETAERLDVPMLWLFAGQDASVPETAVSEIETRLRMHGKSSEVVRYPRVAPGWMFEGRDTYAAEEARDAYTRIIRLLQWTVPA